MIFTGVEVNGYADWLKLTITLGTVIGSLYAFFRGLAEYRQKNRLAR